MISILLKLLDRMSRWMIYDRLECGVGKNDYEELSF
jgi:hypothetical protein